MMQQLWRTFPRQFEQKVNGLLDHAEPSTTKAFQLYKTCQQEKLCSFTFEEFSDKLSLYFSENRRSRNKSDFDRYLDRPMDQHIHDQFHLTFRSAAINSEDIREIASWAHHVLRVGGHIDSTASSIKTLNEVLISVTQPKFFEKDIDIEFSDICDRWQKVISDQVGINLPTSIKDLFVKLSDLDQKSKYARNNGSDELAVIDSSHNFYNFTQTELSWIQSVQKMATGFLALPKYPLSKGPQKIQLIELERIVTLYSIIQLTDRSELLKHRESIRTTVLNRCQQLLREG